MTPDERQHPNKIDASRCRRIARGCGLKEEDIRLFLMMFGQMKQMMKQFSGMVDSPAESVSMGLKMPRNRKTRKKDLSGVPDLSGVFPGMFGQRPSNLPGGKMPSLPKDFPKGGFPPGFFGG